MSTPSPESSRSPTLRELAALLGLSKSTVSAALLGNGRTAPETRELVLRKARELGYRPNLTLSRVARHRFRRVPETLSILALGDIPRPIIIDEITARAPSAGFHCTYERISGEPAVRARLRKARQTGVDAILVVGTLGMSNTEFGSLPEWNHFVVLCASHWPEPFGYPFELFDQDVYEMIHMAWTEVRRRGYRRPGFVLYQHSPEMRDDQLRWAATMILRKAQDARLGPPLVYGGRADLRPAGFSAWMKRHRFDAIIAFSSSTYWWLKDLGFRAPEDIGFATLHALTNDHTTDVRYSGVLHNTPARTEQILATLRNKVILRHLGPPACPLRHLVPTCWHEGATLRPAPA